jgi:hypothetical protein
MKELQAQIDAEVEELQGLTRNQVMDWLNNQLEVVEIKRNDELTGLEILTCYGGPTVRVVLDVRSPDWLEIKGYWGGEDIMEQVYLPKVFGELTAMYELD